jgi:hypothetical protein
MAWPPQIEQWRKFAIWEGKDIPADLILAIIQHESRGTCGRISTGTTRTKADLEKSDGSIVPGYNHALGLMQVIPANIARWNEKASPQNKAYFDDMTGADQRAARLQIRLGAWIFASNVRLLHDYDPLLFPGVSPGSATPEQLRLALVSYAIGFGKDSPPGGRGLKPKLDELKARGLPLTIESLKEVFPNWGYSAKKEMWINRPLHYASIVWDRMGKHGSPQKPGLSEPSNPRALPDIPTIEQAAKKIKNNWPWLLIAVAAFFFLSKKTPAKYIEAGKAKVIGRK